MTENLNLGIQSSVYAPSRLALNTIPGLPLPVSTRAVVTVTGGSIGVNEPAHVTVARISILWPLKLRTT